MNEEKDHLEQSEIRRTSDVYESDGAQNLFVFKDIDSENEDRIMPYSEKRR